MSGIRTHAQQQPMSIISKLSRLNIAKLERPDKNWRKLRDVWIFLYEYYTYLSP